MRNDKGRHQNITKPVPTYILHKRDALILVVVKLLLLLLLSQVFVLGRLKTHGDHLCTGQHLAAVDAISASFF